MAEQPAEGTGAEGSGAESRRAASDSDEVIEARLQQLLAAVVRSLEASGARTEALGSFEARRAILGIRRSPAMVPVERVWRLGVLLLDAQGRLFEIGAVTRAVEPGRVTNQSARAEERRDYRRAAFNGRFDEGDTVNYDAVAVPLDAASLRAGDGVLRLRGDTVFVRWNKRAGDDALAELGPYLIERAALLTAPPP
ncbi:hypothetical protein [Herbiconiux daphne]|uniref:Uncharacterized protein n=1 Tax=Herbiconiux daphne TaxID=2970914 RepID=A0ABT2H186_9MICO|nr:hypothetical protein [Herbiconiux daphne]MCS5733696.1 hypothetical protein [Herbiconiux daphne]